MTAAYYNEIEPYCAQWLRNLIAEKLIAPGDVDDRSIRDVHPIDLIGYTQCHFFAGLGGWPLALRKARWPDDRRVWTGSCPCQPFSVAGERKGFDDERHLWPEFHRLIKVCRPAIVFGEQVAGAADWLRLVRSDLEALEYAVGCLPIEAASAGADHLRDRFWFVADRNGEARRENAGSALGDEAAHGRARRDGIEQDRDHRSSGDGKGDVAQPEHSRREGRHEDWPWSDAALPPGQDGMANPDQLGASEGREQRGGQFGGAGSDPQARAGGEGAWVTGHDGKARRVKPGVRLLADGIPNRVAKLRAFGNAIDPRPAAAFIGAYMDCMP